MGIWVGRYAIVGGEVQEHGPWLVERRRVSDDEAIRLVVLAEPVDERSAEFCHDVADAVAALFRRESLSITGGLLRALRQAHANLAEWNRRSLREHRVAVGVTAVAIRDGIATIAQVGPGSVYVREGDEVRRLEQEPPATEPLGGDEPIEPRFTSVSLGDAEVLLLTSTVESEIGVEGIAAALEAGPADALAELYRRTRELDEMTAALVAEVDAPDDEEPSPFDVNDLGSPASLEFEPARERLPEPIRIAPVDTGRDEPVLRSEPRDLPAVRRPRTVGSTGGPALPAWPWRTIAIALLVIAALGIAAWVLIPSLLAEDRGARLDSAITTASAHLDAADDATDPAERRNQVDLALARIAEARAIEPVDPRLGDLDQRAQELLVVLDAVVDVQDLRLVLPFEGTITAPLDPAGIATGGGRLWLMDAEGRVIAVDPQRLADPVEVYRAGTDYGGTVAAPPASIDWDADAGRLLLLDANRALFSITPVAEGGVTVEPRPLRGVEELRSVADIAVYTSNLYVLDPEGGEVWRYLPAGPGYDSERGGLLGEADLAGALELVVDGDLFVLMPDGIRHFRLGEELEPLLRGVDRPPESPAGLVEDVLRGWFYVADRTGNRLLLSDRDGLFRAQFRHPDFFDLRGLALSGDGGEVYVLTGAAIYAFDPLGVQ